MSVAYSKRLIRGACSFCGHEVTVSSRNRLPRPHAARRVRTGPDGLPQIFKAEDCPGVGMQADPLPEKTALQPAFQAPGVTA